MSLKRALLTHTMRNKEALIRQMYLPSLYRCPDFLDMVSGDLKKVMAKLVAQKDQNKGTVLRYPHNGHSSINNSI